eukprot:CAMPEP_0115296014 /NCGR_PEP_ID=MMETSP0270-20121206/67014_1 /TAXON_ID=71861 /ORGANISM="Scrippsiella trochoidea, Strain CCMP3099" /LENGTH=31 /DNA_ID= /DNA_START= /DNA_END= /DNA_ORIENTATION=
MELGWAALSGRPANVELGFGMRSLPCRAEWA